MYNGIGLPTPRGSGTNGHVQRNWALIKPKEKNKSYRSEAELATLDTASSKQPNKDILDHKRKRKIELKCAEFAEILEEQGYSEEAIKNKVNNYRNMLMSHDGKLDEAVDQWGRPCVTETHQVAEAQQEKNARLREAFGISEYFIDGSSFDPDRQAKEQLAKQEKEKEEALKLEKEREMEKQQATRYELVHTPSPEPLSNDKSEKKKKRKLSSSSEEVKKKKKGKKRKRERSGKSKDKKKKKKRQQSSPSSDSSDEWNSSYEKSDDSSSDDERSKKRKKRKEKRKVKKKRQSSSDSSRESSPEPSTPKRSRAEKTSSKRDRSSSKNKNSSSKKKTGNSHNNRTDFESSKSRGREYEKKKLDKTPIKKPEKSDAESRVRHTSPDKHKSRHYDSSANTSNYKSSYKRRSRSPRSRRSPSDRRYIERRSRSWSSRSEDKYKKDLDNDRKSERIKDDHRKAKSKSSNSTKSRERSRDKSVERYRRRSSEKRIPEKKRSDKDRTPERRSHSKARATEERDRSTKSSYKKKEYTQHSDIKRSRTPPERRVRKSRFAKDDEEQHRISDKESLESKRRKSRGRSLEIHENEGSRQRNIESRNSSTSKDLSPQLPPKVSKSVTRYSPLDSKLKVDQVHSELLESSHKTSKLSKSEKYQPRRHSSSSNNENQECREYQDTTPTKQKSTTQKEKESSKKLMKNKPPMPVVRLRSSSEGESSADDCNNVDEEREKELRMLRLLKSGLAAKAKESLEKKIPKTFGDSFPIAPLTNLPTIYKEENLFSSLPLKSDDKHTQVDPNVFDIKVFKKEKSPPLNFNTETKINVTKEVDDGIYRKEQLLKKSRQPSASKSSRSRSKSNDRKSRSRSSSASSGSSARSSRSRSSVSTSSRSSHSISRSRSRSSSRSGSSSRSSSSSRSRSPSIPRRHGSPSFLDRRRITSARKRPIPYHRQTPSSPSSPSSYSSASPWYSRRRNASRSVSPVTRSPTRSPNRSPRSP